MARDFLNIGCTPCDEDCAQVGSPDYFRRAIKECKAFINQLRRQFGKEPEKAHLGIKAEQHDYGTYHEVVCYYDTDDRASTDYAFQCEGETPQKWDEKAKVELMPSFHSRVDATP